MKLFREDLQAAGFNEALFENADASRGDSAIFRPQSQAQETLLRLFVEGRELPKSEVSEALPASVCELVELGVLVEREDHVSSVLRLRASKGGVFADDFPTRLFDHADDFVMGVASTTRMVKALAPKLEGGKILDLCCGGGWLGITLKAPGISVIGTDLNPRAIEIARINAALNDVSGIDWRVGGWYREVEGEVFDLIISNPPFVVSPGNQSVALDTAEDESVLPAVLEGIADRLTPGGHFCSLLDWPFESVEEWSRKPLESLKQEGLQILLFEVRRQSPLEYAKHWVGQDPRFEKADDFRNEVDRWVEFLNANHYLGISSGFVVIRKCEAGDEWLMEESREISGFNAHSSLDLSRIFEGQTWLQKGVPDLLNVKFQVTPGLIEARQSSLKDGKWEIGNLKLTSPGLVAYDGHVDVSLLRIVTALSEGKVVSEILDELASPLGLPGEAILDQVAELVRELVSYGIILPRP